MEEKNETQANQPETRGASTEELIAALRPLVTKSDRGCAVPVVVELTEDHWNRLNQVWAVLLGDLRKEYVRLGEPLPSPF